MEPVNLMLVGCGIMGARHLRGHAELERARPGSLKLLAVCDLDLGLAEKVAAEAEELLGYRPAVIGSATDALEKYPGIEAADVVTSNRSHLPVVTSLLDAGIHVQIEKPLEVTVARGQQIIEAAKRNHRLLAVAENNKRDPMSRLARHVIQSGFLGKPYLLLATTVGIGRNVIATPWRHFTSHGGPLLDVCIHIAYILESLLGPLDSVYAVSQLVRKQRLWKKPDGAQEEVEVDADDTFSSTLSFKNGVQGNFMAHFGSAGAGHGCRIIFGDQGSLECAGDRSGRPVTVRRGNEILSGDDLVAALPDYALNEIETRLFGDRPGSYQLQSVETDRKLIAAELANFLDAVRGNEELEVPGEIGLRAVGIIYSFCESALAGLPVKVDDVLSGEVCEFQKNVESSE